MTSVFDDTALGRSEDADEAHRAAAYLWIGGGALSLFVLALPRLPGGVERGPLIALAVGSVAWGIAIRLAGLRFTSNSFFVFTLAAVGMIGVGCYYAGSGFGPYAALLFVWAGTYAYYFFSRLRAVVVTVLIAIAYSIVLALQPGNDAPAARLIYLLGTVIAVSALVSWLTHRLQRARVELAELNAELEGRVSEQLDELTRMGELRRFLSPQIADTLLEGGHDELLQPHRREIAVFFCDLRGFTAFTSEVEPEEVHAVLAEYYEELGVLLRRFDATIGPLAGDGVMAYFNDPVPCPDPVGRAVELAVAVREAVEDLSAGWIRKGHELGCGIGLASGYATLGLMGFEGKRDYGPVGSVVNRASRLCDEAGAGQILVDLAMRRQLDDCWQVDELAPMELKGFPRPVPAFAVMAGTRA